MVRDARADYLSRDGREGHGEGYACSVVENRIIQELPTGHRVHPKMKILSNLYSMGRMESIWGRKWHLFR
ncbi:hypothetical protein V6N12_047459 [Hibiscus sabdariffa]|uniref:Uncharacterized protein n=1 Tax=Hibiscus sabdariffa TaxID=183260 RepID=A0ABR2DDS4_9ROSI